MIILNTSFHCRPTLVQEVINWLRERGGRLYAIRTELPEDSEGLAHQMEFPNIEEAQNEADALAAEFSEVFKDQLGRDVVFFSTYLEQL